MPTPSRRPVFCLPSLAIVGLFLVAGPFQVAAAAQLDDTTWVMNGKATLKLSGGEGIPKLKQTVKGAALLQLLPGGACVFEDAAATSIEGSWSAVGDGMQITVTTDDIETFLDENLGALASVLQNLQVGDLSSDAKLTQKKGGVGLLVYKLAFVLSFTVDGEPVKLTYKVVVKGQYDLSGASSGGATWALDGKQLYKAKGVSLPETGGLQLVLGSDGGLADDRFVLRDGEGAELYGGYATSVGKKLYLLPDAGPLEAFVEAWIAPTVQQKFPGGDVTLEVSTSTFTGAVKKDGTLKLKGKVVFASDLDRGAQSGFFKSSYKLTASG